MPAILNLQNTLLFVMPFINWQPMTQGGMEPALSCGNLIKQTMLGAPFCWRWNRVESTALTLNADGTQDYQVSFNDFGFLEKAWLTTADDKKIHELTIMNALAKTREKGQPAFISPLLEDQQGGLVSTSLMWFRFAQAPKEAYQVALQYQRKAALMVSLASRWYPIPDELSYIYNWGVLALAGMLNDDPRWPAWNQKFIAHLLGAQDGLNEMQRNLFLGNWTEVTRSLERGQLRIKSSVAGA